MNVEEGWMGRELKISWSFSGASTERESLFCKR